MIEFEKNDEHRPLDDFQQQLLELARELDPQTRAELEVTPETTVRSVTPPVESLSNGTIRRWRRPAVHPPDTVVLQELDATPVGVGSLITGPA